MNDVLKNAFCKMGVTVSFAGDFTAPKENQK